MEEREITLEEMLDARERRWHRQQTLLGEQRGTLLSFTMNIPGPVKNSDAILRGFRRGQGLIEGQMKCCGLPILHREERLAPTGNEALYVIDAPPEQVKALTAEIEDRDDMGRLYDMDVLRHDGTQVSRASLGLGERTCLICGGPAKVCSSTRAHSVPELQKAVNRLLEAAFRREDGERAASLAVQSLLYELCATPKPGLVDCADSGSHRDMDRFTFAASAAALYPYFRQCVETGRETAAAPPEETLCQLRWHGKQAEQTMYRATGGVNTHKGAIFSMGLACAALGRLERSAWGRPEQVLEMCGRMCRGLTERELGEGRSATAGQRLYLRYRVTGIRGQAEAGFPGVKNAGLPTLEQALDWGADWNAALCTTLLSILATTEDTNLMARGDCEAAQWAAQQAVSLLAEQSVPGREALEELNRRFVERNLSPGGSADLLALTCFLYSLKEEC